MILTDGCGQVDGVVEFKDSATALDDLAGGLNDAFAPYGGFEAKPCDNLLVVRCEEGLTGVPLQEVVDSARYILALVQFSSQK